MTDVPTLMLQGGFRQGFQAAIDLLRAEAIHRRETCPADADFAQTTEHQWLCHSCHGTEQYDAAANFLTKKMAELVTP